MSRTRAALGNLKTAFAGTYHAFRSPEYAARYLAQFRMNYRYRLDLIPVATLRALVRAGPAAGWRCRVWR